MVLPGSELAEEDIQVLAVAGRGSKGSGGAEYDAPRPQATGCPDGVAQCVLHLRGVSKVSEPGRVAQDLPGQVFIGGAVRLVGDDLPGPDRGDEPLGELSAQTAKRGRPGRKDKGPAILQGRVTAEVALSVAASGRTAHAQGGRTLFVLIHGANVPMQEVPVDRAFPRVDTPRRLSNYD